MVDPVPLALTFAKLAINNGVKIVEDCEVKEILTEKQRAGQYDRVTSAVTSQGNIKCDVFINCTGLVKFRFLFEKKKKMIHFLVGSRTWISIITRCTYSYTSMR
jgi:glycine/D-amino acid oxidase-like deaminating enzyme